MLNRKVENSLRSNEPDTNSDGDSIKVFLRVRPPDDSEGLVNYGQCLDVQKPDTVILRIKAEKKVFTFDHVADPDTTQEEVFTAVGKRTIESCVKGYNGTILHRPSEKGDNFHHELRGVIPRSFEYLFSLVNREREKQGDKFEFLCRCSFLEIYNEQIFDLLDPASAGLNLRENMKKGVFVDGIIEQTVNSPHEAYNVLSAGWLNRRVAATSMNRESSRSHAVFTVSIETKEKKAGVANVKVSQLHLVDLAGSERQKDTKTDGIRLKEAGSINKSLSTLGNVIMALVDIAHGKKRFVPYRNSKLSFLLRDSLGGNSKTFIIANVHPGAKCFGETLSTLNFARRAKMIKNKAVVNEDAQGNVSHLQAEIRRLKEELCQFQTGTIPHPLGPAAGDDINNEATVGSQNVGVSSSELRKWKKNFYNAMKLREESVKDLTDRVSQLETLCRKKDKFIQSSKMITRFRENTIAQLQKTGQMSPTEKEKSLTAEVRAMKELVEHNPMVLKYAIENKKLREEVQRLKTMEMVQSGLDFTAEQCAQLDKAFKELKENVDDAGNFRFDGTPSSTPTSMQVPVATVERQKAQLQELQAQLDSTRQEAAEQKELFHRKRTEMEGELESSRRNARELETALEGMKAKNRLERDAMHDMHMQTIKTITTPKKKAAYSLRSRLVLRSSDTPTAGQSGEPCSDSTPPRGDDRESPMGIIDEEVPDHVLEQCTEALTVEVQKLQEKNTELHNQQEVSEENVMKMAQQISKLEYQNELHSEEKTEWSQMKENLMHQVEKLTEELSTLRNTYEITRGEAEDFRLMLQSVDKQHLEEMQRCQSRDCEQEKLVSELQTKLVKAESLTSQLQHAIDEGCHDKQQLEERNYTLEAEVSFMEQQRRELEERLLAEVTAKKELAQETESIIQRLELESEKNSRLTQEIKEGSDSTQKLGEMNDQIGKENESLRKTVLEQESRIDQLEKDVQSNSSLKITLEQQLAETREAMSQILGNLQEQRTKLAEKRVEVDELGQQLLISEHEKEEVAVVLERVQMNLEEVEAHSQMAANKYEEKIRTLQDDLQEMNCQHSDLLIEMEKQETFVQSSQADCEDLNECIADLEKKLKDIEQQLEETQANISTVMVESAHSLEAQETMQELESYPLIVSLLGSGIYDY
ncbi:Kinesin-like protein KIF15 [Apostichopus japonicus]|uniref:Kinesin-like protein KIF15 n=1 Tax=Stichopus japonicus TaxID=307972 RepID=A0A2G8LNL3_STIJA|nr:Kinesin-like protein KIF15 [Apostichopus japonicus]